MNIKLNDFASNLSKEDMTKITETIECFTVEKYKTLEGNKGILHNDIYEKYKEKIDFYTNKLAEDIGNQISNSITKSIRKAESNNKYVAFNKAYTKYENSLTATEKQDFRQLISNEVLKQIERDSSNIFLFGRRKTDE